MRYFGDCSIGDFPDKNTILAGNPLQQYIDCFFRSFDAAKKITVSWQTILKVSLGMVTDFIEIDPQGPIENDYQLLCQFRSLAL